MDTLTKVVNESCLFENSKKKKKGSPFLLSTPTYQRPILRESSFLHVVTESLLYRKLPLSKREKLESRSDILPATSLVAFSSL